PRSRRHDARAPWRAEHKNHSRRCGRLFARRGPPALPGSMVLAVDSCGLSRSCIAPIENAEDVLRWNFGAGECRIFVRTPLPRANLLAIAGAARIRHGHHQSPCLSVHVYWTIVGHQLILCTKYLILLALPRDSNPCFRRERAKLRRAISIMLAALAPACPRP